ncbi:MAG: hypothetical protein V4723_15600 [Pseudomonadota bacterium]
MTTQFALRLAVLAASAGLAACTTVLLPPNVTPVVASTTSLDEAARKLAAVRAERASAEAQFAESERFCSTKFFVNTCLDAAKEKRRSTLAVLRATEVEAELFQRKSAADQRDAEVAKAVREFEAEEARQAALPPTPPRVAAEPPPVAPKPALAARRASRAAKDAQRAAQAPLEAAERAANAAAYEKRRLESIERQKKVEEKKAARAAKKVVTP